MKPFCYAFTVLHFQPNLLIFPSDFLKKASGVPKFLELFPSRRGCTWSSQRCKNIPASGPWKIWTLAPEAWRQKSWISHDGVKDANFLLKWFFFSGDIFFLGGREGFQIFKLVLKNEPCHLEGRYEHTGRAGLPKPCNSGKKIHSFFTEGNPIINLHSPLLQRLGRAQWIQI